MLGQRTVSEKWDLGDISPELTDALVEDIGFPADVAVENLTPHELGILGEALAGAFVSHQQRLRDYRAWVPLS